MKFIKTLQGSYFSAKEIKCLFIDDRKFKTEKVYIMALIEYCPDREFQISFHDTHEQAQDRLDYMIKNAEFDL